MTSSKNSLSEVVNLPKWRIEDLFSTLSHAQESLNNLVREIDRFVEWCPRDFSNLSSEEVSNTIVTYEKLESQLARLTAYSDLRIAADGDNDDIILLKNILDKVQEISERIVFFNGVLGRSADQIISLSFFNKVLAHYIPYIYKIKSSLPHFLEEKVEEYAEATSFTRKDAWIKLYDKILSSSKFMLENEYITLDTAHSLMSNKNADTRRLAAQGLGRTLKKNGKYFVYILNALIKEHSINNRLRNYPYPAAHRNSTNEIEGTVVDCFTETIKENYHQLSHRYYKIKAKKLNNSNQIQFWDRNAPFDQEDNEKISWEEAQEIILEAYGSISIEMKEICKNFFDNKWIDAQPKPNKMRGAFLHPAVPEVHPYLLINYRGRKQDVMTLAHELGHGIHQVLSASHGYLLSQIPLTISETASIFGERLTFQVLLKRETNTEKRKTLLAGKIEGILNRIVRQIALYDFEKKIHERGRQQDLTSQEICNLWIETIQASMGPSVHFNDSYRYFWAYVPHFFHSPFYVYSYAFGDGVANSLYAKYQEGKKDFSQNYVELLKAGATKNYKELLKPFDLDITNPEFWKRGIKSIVNLIDQLN